MTLIYVSTLLRSVISLHNLINNKLQLKETEKEIEKKEAEKKEAEKKEAEKKELEKKNAKS